MKVFNLLYNRLKKLITAVILMTCWNYSLMNQQVLVESRITSPVRNPLLTQRFSTRHKGFDIIDKFNDRRVYSITRCRISQKGFTGNLSPFVICYDFNNQLNYKYIHIRSDLNLNQIIDSGDYIGDYNNEGNSIGFHLHLEVYDVNNIFDKESVNKWKM